MVLIAPSLLSADFLHLGREIESVEQAGADYLHIDVMDGHFVPNLTMGPPVIAHIKSVASIPLDVHLMIEHPSMYVKTYVDNGADIVTIHAEASRHLERDIKEIKALSAKAGVALNPSTHESALQYIIDELDIILVMTVNPGFGGQVFLDTVITKIENIKHMLRRAGNSNCLIFVDGGINDKTAPLCINAGADGLVAGSYIFKSPDYKKAIRALKG